MKTKLITAPTVEPVTLAELELHLRINSNSFADDIASIQSIVPGSHVVVADYGLTGTGVDVLNYAALVVFSAGACGAGGTVDVKIQESDDNITYADWAGGSFDQVSEASDNATYEKEYTGVKQYIRTVATVAGATCEFGVSVIRDAPASVEDTYLTNLIKASRRILEKLTGYRFVSQTWELALDRFPSCDRIAVPYPPLQSVTSITYYDTDETAATFSSDDYHVDTYGEPGNIVLGYGDVWPSTTLRPVNGVIVRFVCGFGDAASDVPDEYKTAIQMLAAEFYERREVTDYQRFEELPWSVRTILGYDRIVQV